MKAVRPYATHNHKPSYPLVLLADEEVLGVCSEEGLVIQHLHCRHVGGGHCGVNGNLAGRRTGGRTDGHIAKGEVVEGEGGGGRGREWTAPVPVLSPCRPAV